MKKFFVLFTAIAMICAFSMPAAAMEEMTSEEMVESLMSGVGGFSLYGSARMATFRIDSGEDEDTQWDLQGNSRFGLRANHGAIGGRIEFAVNDESGVNTRLMYGTYQMGAGELLVGQGYTPISSYFYSNQVFGGDEDLLGTGALYAGRQPMIQFKTGGFKVALVEPGVSESLTFGNDPQGNPLMLDVDTTFPKLEASYGFKTDMFFLDISGGIQQVSTEGLISEDWNSWVGSLGGGFTAGPVAVKANIMYAENGALYGVYSPWLSLASGWNGTSAVDNETLGYMGIVTFNANDMLSFEVGGAYRKVELGSFEDNVTSYYVNSVIKFAPNFFIVPEIGVVDIDSYNDNMTYFGMKTQINF